MEKREIEKRLNEDRDILEEIKKASNFEEKENRTKELEIVTSREDFWGDINSTKDIIAELKNLKQDIKLFNDTLDKLNTCVELLELDISDDDVNLLEEEIIDLEKSIDSLKLKTLLNGEYDSYNAYIEIHSGAGGTESNDWANMIYKMYTKFFDNNDYTYEIVNEQKGEEVGIKGITLLVKGYYSYGYLKNETGVHRLVRISPFDSNKRRHTSFASVLVTPQISKKIDIEIKESEIKIDVYHSSGAGGQSVNTTDSAVRITHLPTGIVTSCQTQRSQLQNKELALNMLKEKLYMITLKEFEDKIKSLKGDNMDVNFGSAIRSYVMCPYTLVKDNRSNFETPNVDKVLDGEIMPFLETGLKL